jgi:hypothetical protein
VNHWSEVKKTDLAELNRLLEAEKLAKIDLSQKSKEIPAADPEGDEP